MIDEIIRESSSENPKGLTINVSGGNLWLIVGKESPINLFHQKETPDPDRSDP